MTASASASETIYAPSGGVYGFTHSVSWSELNPSVSTNKSTISASASLGSNVTSFRNNYDQHLSIYWFDNNQYQNGKKIAGIDFSSCGMGYGTRTVTGTLDVPHKDDGTLSGYCVSYFSKNQGGSFTPPDNAVETSAEALDTIARVSVPSVSPNPITLSQATNALTVNTNRKSTSFTHEITCTIGSFTETKTGITDSTTFDIPKTVLSDFTATSKTLEGTISCVTKNGATTIGTKEVTFTAQIDETQEHPNITSVTLTDTNPNSAAIEAQGSFIANASNLRATIALGVAGSYTELNEATVVCGKVSQTYVLSGTSQTIVFEQEGLTADNLKVMVTDARGTTITETRTWNLIPYVSLTALGQVRRTSEIGNEVAISVTGRCFAGDFGQASNVITVKMKSKLHTASDYPTDWTTLGTVTPSGEGETTFTFQTTRTGYDYDQQYDFLFYVEDLFTSSESAEVVVTTGIPVYGNGADFFAVYGDSFLHWDRTDPSKFWNINDALNGILAHSGQKNLLPITAKTATVEGITYTVNSNGSIRAVGTATGYSSFTIGSFTAESGLTYILSGCPEGGGSRTFSLGVGSVHDYGEGAEITGTGSQDVYIDVFSGQTVDLTFWPMLRDARIASDEFLINPLKALTNGILKYNTSGIWFRVQIGKLLVLLATNATGGQLQFGVTFDSVPFVLTGAPQGGYGHSAINQQIWDLTTSSMRWDAYYGSNTKYGASLMVIGLYSGQI